MVRGNNFSLFCKTLRMSRLLLTFEIQLENATRNPQSVNRQPLNCGLVKFESEEGLESVILQELCYAFLPHFRMLKYVFTSMKIQEQNHETLNIKEGL